MNYLTRAQYEIPHLRSLDYVLSLLSPPFVPLSPCLCIHIRSWARTRAVHTRNSILQIHQNVIAPPEQPHHHRLYADVQQRYLSRTGLAIIERGGVPVYLHGQSVAADGRFLIGIRLHVLENLAGAFNIHRREAQQEGSSLLTNVARTAARERALTRVYTFITNFRCAPSCDSGNKRLSIIHGGWDIAGYRSHDYDDVASL